jgi:predicted esterase
VKYGFGVASADALKAAGVPVAFKTYGGMGHSACPAELSDVAAFLSERLPPV